MGCGKSKHDVVTGNTKTIRKPSEAESVKGKESETIKRQGSCRCRKTKDISAVVSGEQPETTVENNNKKPEEKEAGGDCGEKTAVEMTNDDNKREEKETTTSSPLVTPVMAIVPENIVAEETVNYVNESVSPVDEQKEKVDDIETAVEEEKSVEGKNDGYVDTEISSPEVEEPQSNVQAPETNESAQVQEIPTTENDEIEATENDEITVTENDDVVVLKDEDKVDESPADIKKEVESA